ncbi:zinc transporter 7 [Microplitis mediator]|uniref:zinc transporter 7 n=1 Tax=Microplitis mediator TaxID=375433 RepID=UPI0025568D23|nr:zinc transporter 7 [Microplitis mediator]
MLPLSHKDSKSITSKIIEKIYGWKRLIFSDPDTRNLFLFLLLNFSFAIVELLYGMWTNSLGLISDGFHMFFDCTALVTGLVASVVTKWRANERYSFGYVRAEVLAGFVNGLGILVLAYCIMSAAFERLFEPPEVKHEKLFVVSVLGLLVNLVGVYAFQHGHSHGGHGHSHGGGHSHGHGGGHGHSHGNHAANSGPVGISPGVGVGVNMELGHGHGHAAHGYDPHSHNHNHSHNHDHQEIEIDTTLATGNSQIMKGVFLHILADTLGSVGVIVSAILIQMFGWMIADPICSMFIAVMITLSVLSLLKESTSILMQRQPTALDHLLPGCYNKVTQLSGVYSVQEPHFWTLCSDVYVGTLKLEVAKTVDPKYVVAHTEMIFHAAGVRHLTVQLDYTSM